jgi:integrase/recombinase XerD
MPLDELLHDYQQHLRALNRAPKTIAARLLEIHQFFEFAQTLGVRTPADIADAHLRAYQKHLLDRINRLGRVNTVTVQNQRLAAPCAFLRHLHVEGYLAHNPTLKIQYAKEPVRLPRDILTVAETRKLLRIPDVHTVAGYRDRTIMEMLYSSGIRRQELINLTVDDVNLESRLLTIRQGKGGKDRVVPLGRIAARFLETYLNGIRPQLLAPATKPPTQRLFIGPGGHPLSKTTLSNHLHAYRRAAHLPQRVTPHVFRHTCATHMIRNRANIRHLQELLGHSDLNTTQKYLHLTITDLKEAHHKFHPREKDV